MAYDDGIFSDSVSNYIEYFRADIKYSYSRIEPTYVCENMESILHFISIWQFLESERLIIDLPKSCEKQDMGLFLKRKTVQPEHKYISDNPCSTFDLMICASEFMDWKFELDEHNFEICLPYLQKQIQPTLALNTFIENKFRTKSDLSERRNFLIALVGVIVAVVTSIASLVISAFDRGNTEELNKINNSLQEIKQLDDIIEYPYIENEETSSYQSNVNIL